MVQLFDRDYIKKQQHLIDNCFQEVIGDNSSEFLPDFANYFQ